MSMFPFPFKKCNSIKCLKMLLSTLPAFHCEEMEVQLFEFHCALNLSVRGIV